MTPLLKIPLCYINNSIDWLTPRTKESRPFSFDMMISFINLFLIN